MQVPRSWIYNYSDPVALMQDWDTRMDMVSKLLGYPPTRSNTMLDLQIDVDIMFGGYGIGNPQINNTYDPAEIEDGNKHHWFLTPGVTFWETEFHEMGHAQLFSKFPGETEAAVNLLAAAIYNRLYGMNIDTALGESFDNHPQITRDQAALNWMVTPNFRAGNPMDISNTTKDEVRYQQRGYAKYVEMAALFGWDMIDSFYRKENADFIAQTPDDGLSEVDSRILRLSRTAGADLRPLIHFWGVQPKNALELKARIDAEHLLPSRLICDRLTHYKAILPANKVEFVTHANAFFGGNIPPGGHPDYGSGWYNIWKTQYDTAHGSAGKHAVQSIMDLYFPDGCPEAAPVPAVTVTSRSICPGESATLTASGAMYYHWSNGEEGSSISVSPNTTTTYTVIGTTAGYSSAPVSAQVTVLPLPGRPSAPAGDTLLCAGSPPVPYTTKSVPNASMYAWSLTPAAAGSLSGDSSSPSITVTWREDFTGMVKLGVTASNDCGWGAVSDMLSVRIAPIPVVALGDDVTMSMADTIILNAGPGFKSYRWNDNSAQSSLVVIGNLMGLGRHRFDVTVTSTDDCPASDTVYVTVNDATGGVEPLPFEDDLALYPNPNSGSFVVMLPAGASRNARIEIVSVDGATVYTKLLEQSSRQLRISNLPKGIYLVRHTNAIGTSVCKMIVE
ncbi:MAG: T9SS type A sorting domain-containing protein [Ignavibacteria bacterium]|nr:T9SS type A sorting domain-containing protein [Ignavibacteria bacterium]